MGRLFLDHFDQVAIDVSQFRLLFLDQQMVFDPFSQNRSGKRFGHVVGRSEGQAFQLVRFLNLGSDKNDGNAGVSRVGLEDLEDIKAIHIRHQNIQQNQIRRHRFQKFEQSFRRRQRVDFVEIFEHDFSHVQVDMVVVHEHDCLSFAF